MPLKPFAHQRPRVLPNGLPRQRPSAPPSLDAAGFAALAPATLAGLGGLTPLSAGHGDAGGHGQASVEAIKDGTKVSKLIVTCSCGERIEILCAYTPAP
jgi:hypothetical protein